MGAFAGDLSLTIVFERSGASPRALPVLYNGDLRPVAADEGMRGPFVNSKLSRLESNSELEFPIYSGAI
jgi:hypothetical protein